MSKKSSAGLAAACVAVTLAFIYGQAGFEKSIAEEPFQIGRAHV